MAETTLNTPGLWVNEYLKNKIFADTKLALPFFPVRPNSIDDLTERWVVLEATEVVDGKTIPVLDINGKPVTTRAPYEGILAVYDRLIRMRRSPFPHIKCEQLLYYFYATQDDVTNKMVQIQEAVLRLMDRGDETAEEINNWCKGKTIGNLQPKFYFHNFKVYQLEEVRDIIDFGTARTYGGNKIIIDFDYHQDTTISQ